MFALLAFAAATATNPALIKPARPQFPTLAASSCDDPTQRSKALTALESSMDGANSATNFNKNWSNYIDGRVAQLKMKSEEQSNFMLGLLKAPEFLSILSRNDAILDQMQGDMKALEAATDETSACKTVAHMLGLLSIMIGNAEQQWLVIDGYVAAEAKRRGITLID